MIKLSHEANVISRQSLKSIYAKRTLIAFLSLGSLHASHANVHLSSVVINQTNIRGKVVDSSGAAVAGATVKVTNSATSTFSNAAGEFSIAASIGQTLEITAVGYSTKTISIVDSSPLQIILEQGSESIDEVVVVGYGSVRKSDLTGSVSTISSKQITQVNAVSNVAQALQGQAAGVRVNQASGQPGEGMKIQIRGTNSLAGGNDPLYVVDGMPLDALSAQINPEDIESVSVLKDASSTAIYGSRGANGVIMITTKKGKSGETKVGFSTYLGNQNLRKKIDVLGARDFATLQNEVAQNEGKALPWTQTQIDGLSNGTDWQDLVYRNAKVQNYDLNMSGGSDKTKYFTSFGYFNQDGIIRNSGFDRLSFRGNIDHTIHEKFNILTTFSIQNSKYAKAQFESADGGGGIPWSSMVLPPTMNVFDENGNYTKFTGVSWGETNPVGLTDNWNRNDNNLRIIGNINLNYSITPDLKLKLSAGIDNSNNKYNEYFPGNISLGQRTDADGKPIYGAAYKQHSTSTTFINENVLEYNKRIDIHNINAVAGFTYQTSKYDYLNSGTAVGFLSDVFEYNNIQSAITKALPNSGFSDNKLISYLARVNYGLLDRYMLTLTGRYDGSSRFGLNNKFAFFPSAAFAWTVSNEEFMKDASSISLLKLRTSYGKAGNQAIGSYQTLPNVSSTDIAFDNAINTAFYLSALANPNLKWETTAQFDIGFELGLWGDKLRFEADYYKKKTSDLLLNVTLPGSSGFGSVLQNIGLVENKGFEFAVSSRPVSREDFKWNTSLNITANRTKVLDMGNDANGNPITYKEIGTGGNWFPTLVGQSMMQLYGYTVEGIYQSKQEAIDNGEPNKDAGDYKFKNWDGEGVVNDSDDRTILTNFEPKFTFGFNNEFTYKKFDLSFLIVGSFGNDMVNEFRKYNISMNGDWNVTQEAFDNRYTGNGNAKFDKPSDNSGSAIRDYANSLWVEDGSYLRLRDVTLGYTFGNDKISSLKLSNLRFYVSMQNFLTITKYSGYDPEVSWAAASVNGWDRGNYPSFKSITAGLRVNF